MTTSFWGRVADTGSRFAFCVLFMVLARALGFGLRCCRNFSAAALACSGSWHVASAGLPVPGLLVCPPPALLVTRENIKALPNTTVLTKSQNFRMPSPSKCSMHLVRLTESWRHTKWSKLALPFWIRVDNADYPIGG